MTLLRMVHTALAAVAFTLVLAPYSPLRAEVAEVGLTGQYGLSYLTFEVMKQRGLVEKQLAARGLGETKVKWVTFSDGAVQNDALLSGQVHVAAGGIGAFVTLWDRTRTTLRVKAISALATTPALLNVRDPAVRSMADVKPDQRIGLPGAKVSPQAITIQREAANELGQQNWAAFDRYTTNLSHPLAMQAMIGGGEVIGHFATIPYSFMELKDPKVHTILDSYKVWGGKQTLIVAWCTGKFRDDNPKTFDAVAAAIAEATDWINADKEAASRLYLDASKDKLDLADVVAILKDPANEWSMTPHRLMPFAVFKHEIGTLKQAPVSWKDMFFDTAHNLSGS